MASSSGRQPKFAALNRGHHLCLAGRPSRWALARILVVRHVDLFVSMYPSYLTGLMCACRSVEAGKRTVSLFEQDSFEDEFAELGTCVAMYPFDGE